MTNSATYQTAIQTYLINLFTEKGLTHQIAIYAESKSLFGFDFNAFIQFVNSLDKATKEKIRMNFVKIDFANGDIMHFAKFIIDGIVKQYGI